MSLFTIDQSKCLRDGICVAECPLGLILLKDKESVPTPSANAQELCVNCGHCVAVCPQSAFSLRTMTPEQCLPVQDELRLSPEQMTHFLCSRRSIRKYKDTPVERETLIRLIEIARYAPSGHNRQPVRWLVIHNTDEVRKMAGMVVDWMRHVVDNQPEFAKMMMMSRVIKAWDQGADAVCRNAPHVIVTHALKADGTAPTAATIALTYLELAAIPLGLGACWAGYFYLAATLWQPLQEVLGLPDSHAICGAMMMGYPNVRYHRIPLRNEPEITWK